MEARVVLEALADTLVPALEPGADDPPALAALMARSASAVGVAAALADLADRHAELLAALGRDGFSARESLDGRTRRLAELAADPASRQELRELRGAILAAFYALPDAGGRNPNWDAIGYPGPVTAPPSAAQAPKTIAVEELDGPRADLDADVCIVGSGAGGSVLAAGGYRNEADFRQLDAVGAREMYLRGGLFFSDGGSIGLLAGATLGGGTVINSMVCLRPSERVRSQWAAMGIGGVDGPAFDAHLDAVSER